MSEEITQTVMLEIEGVKVLYTAVAKLIGLIAAMIKALWNWTDKKWKEKPGSCTFKKIQEVSEGTAPILECPKEMFQETIDITKDKSIKGKGMISPFEYYCRKNDLRYCVLPDLNEFDDYIPVAVPMQDFGIHDEKIKSFMRARIKAQEDKDREYDEKIEKAKQILEGAASETDKKEIMSQIAALEQAKSQNGELLAESKEKIEKDNVIDVASYMKQGEGTKIMDDPELALRQANICGVVRELLPDKCMYPIREDKLVPDSGVIIYSQKTGDDKVLSIKRTFEKDEDYGLYSVYETTDPVTGKKHSIITDKGCSKEEWAAKLSEVLSKAGMYADQPVCMFRSADSFSEYLKGLETNFTQAHTDGLEISEQQVKALSQDQLFESRSSFSAESKAEELLKDVIQRNAYEASQSEIFTVETNRLMPSDNRRLSLDLGDGIVENIMLDGMDADKAKIIIRSDMKYPYVSGEGISKEIDGSEIIKALTGKGNQSIVEKAEKKLKGR